MSKGISHFEENTAMKNEENTDSDASTSKREYDENNPASEIVKKQKVEEGNIISDVSAPDLTNKLTLDELLVLFSWLSIDDLLTVRRVCHIWRVAAQDKSLWRNPILTVKYRDKYDKKIKLMPYIMNIRGWGHSTLLDAILENVIKLKTLNVAFLPPLLPLKVGLISQRYPELESITLNASDPVISESLEILKSSSHLKEIQFQFCDGVGGWIYSDFIDIFTDIKNFPRLTDLCLCGVDFFRDAMNPHFRDVLCNIIKNRSQQLSLLKLCFPMPQSPEVFDAISQCNKLQTLKLVIKSVNTNLNIERMTQLRSLYLRLTSPYFRASENQNLNFFTSVKSSLYKGSWSKLTEVNISVTSYVTMCLLKAIIDNAKSLKSLTYKQRGFYISDDQLEDINTLVNFESLELRGVQNITEKGICYITECHKLKNIELVLEYSDINFNSNCIKDMLLQLNNLQSLSITKIGDGCYTSITKIGDRYTRITKEREGYAKLFLANRREIERHIASIGSQHH